MKRIFKALALLLLPSLITLIVVLVVMFLLPDLWAPALKAKIEAKASQAIAGEVKIQQLRFARLWPLTLSLRQIQLRSALDLAKGEIREVNLAFSVENLWRDWHRPVVVLQLAVNGPQIQVQIPKFPEDQSATGGSVTVFKPSLDGLKAEPALVVPDVRLQFLMESGAFSVAGEGVPMPLVVKSEKLVFSLPSLRTVVLAPELGFSGGVAFQVAGRDWSLPITLNLPRAEFTGDRFKITEGRLAVAGVTALFEGERVWVKGDEWKWQIEPVDLSQLPVPPDFLPPGKWRGFFRGQGDLSRSVGQQWQAKGQILSQDLVGSLQQSFGALTVAGELPLQMSFKMNYGKALSIDDASLSADLSRLSLEYPPWFRLPVGTDTHVALVSDLSNDQLNFRRVQARMGPLRLDGQGQVQMKGERQMQVLFRVQETQLSGLEKMILPLAQSPVSGFLSAAGEIKGSLKDVSQAFVFVKQFELRDVSGKLAYQSKEKDLSIQGPVQGGIRARADVQGLKPQVLAAEYDFDLSGLEVKKTGLAHKKPGFALKLKGSAGYQNQSVILGRNSVTLPEGVLHLQGTSGALEKPEPNLSVQLEKVRLGPILKLLEQPPFEGDGTLVGAIALKGQWDQTKGLSQSPLRLSGDVKWLQGSLVLPDAKPSVVPQPPPDAQSKEASSLIPTWPVLKTANLGLALEGFNFRQGALSVKDIHVKGRLQRGQWAGEGRIGNFFGGQVLLSKLNAQPFLAPSDFLVAGDLKGVQVEPLLTWFKPGLRGYASGAFTSAFTAQGVFPTAANWLEMLKVNGQVSTEALKFSSFRLEQMVGEKLAAVGLGSPPSKAQPPLPLFVSGRFSFAEGHLNMKPLLLRSQQMDEFKAQGVVGTDLTADVSGTLYLKSVNVGGSVREANSDAQGRLVIPVQFKGSLLNPSLHIAETTLKSMASKTLEFEKRKAVKNLQKNLEQEAKKKLKSLFGK